VERDRRKRLGEILVASGVLTEAQLEDALVEQSSGGRRHRLGTTIIRMGLSTESDIARALARQLGLDTVDLADVGSEPAALQRVPRSLAERHHALPLRIDPDDHLVVAMSDPTNVVAFDDLKLTSGLRGVRPVVSTESAVGEALRRAYGSDRAALDMVEGMSDGDVTTVEEADEDLATATGGDDQPIIRLANAILADAVRSRTSDVHVEPEREHVRVRYRIDGLLRETMRVPKHIGPALTSRLKIMSSLDIAERRRPQDGRAMIRVESQEVDLRVSTMPTMFGETVVMRLLRKGAERLTIDDLGISPDARTAFESALDRPQGLILVTGPTGSGKTTTLYAGLSIIAEPVRNLITLEDPIEYQLEGINQTQVNPKIDLTFARGLRTILRQDPDVVMVGEIRDRETAELAMEASFTGHLVLSTLHTNDAPSTIVRLVDLGVERFLIASSLILVAGQRLCRSVCPHCREPATPDPRTVQRLGLEAADLDDVQLVRGVGCQVCDKTGYLGRTALLEVLRVTPEMRELITDGGSETAIGRLARQQGMRTLRADGIAKAMAGITTLDEVLRVTPDESLTADGRDPVDRPHISPELVAQVAATAPTAAGIAPAAGKAPEAGPPPAAVPAPVTVLVVDDDPSMRALLQTVLADGYRVVEAEDGETALAWFERDRPEVVLLDLELPGLDGIEVTRRIRALDDRAATAILAVTGIEDPATEVEGLLAGIDDYVTKPFEEEVLVARIQAALRRTAGPA
jgi:type IV pilus assembly protein PilB